MLRPRQLNRVIAAIARHAKAVSITLDRAASNAINYEDTVTHIYRSGANRRVNARLQKLRLTQVIPLERRRYS
jgi:hypothetical protein